uniref:Methyltransferase type 11 domain-containing protein n=1 Tax=Palpitomonas bilix TaxID=652834 RepID=A0A7S3GHM6_9EUKA|mmetsp:Transcript_49789/g.128099  ORF Transcript_49789/g.128099 Transcript_49789/m.128099 type:complete len:270 (+) Transcript_49789:20-829(+)
MAGVLGGSAWKEAGVAARYAAFRPSYSKAIFDAIAKFSGKSEESKGETAVDIATGSGQAAFPLSTYFKRVLAVDFSQAQVDAGNSRKEKPDNVTFMLGSAEHSGVDASTADLVTAAQAAHWFDIPAFAAEAKRVLRPQGTLSVWTYDLGALETKEANATFQGFYHDTLDGCWSEKRKIVDARYEPIYEELKHHFGTVEKVTLEMPTTMTIHALVNYIGTWSGYAEYMKVQGRDDPLPSLLDRLVSDLHASSPHEVTKVVWPVTLINARV